MKEKTFIIAAPRNKVYKFYQNKFNDCGELYGIKLTENDRKTTKILPISLNKMVDDTSDKDNLYFELSKNDATNILDEDNFTNRYLTSGDIKTLANHCNFDLAKLEEFKSQNDMEMGE